MVEIIPQQKPPYKASLVRQHPEQNLIKTNRQASKQPRKYQSSEACIVAGDPEPTEISTKSGVIAVCEVQYQTTAGGYYSPGKRPKEDTSNDRCVDATEAPARLCLNQTRDWEEVKSTEKQEGGPTRTTGRGTDIARTSKALPEWRTESREAPDAKEAAVDRGRKKSGQQKRRRLGNRNYATPLEIRELKSCQAESRSSHLGVVDEKVSLIVNREASSGINTYNGIPTEKANETSSKISMNIRAGKNMVAKMAQRLMYQNWKRSIPP